MSKVNNFVEFMLNNGWSIERSRKHLVLRSPFDKLVTIGRSIPDKGSGAMNTLATLKRFWREYERERQAMA